MRQDRLLVVDMQNAYLPDNAWGCPAMPVALGRIRRLLEAGLPAVFTRFLAPAEPVGAWRQYNKQCAAVSGSAYLNDLVAELKPYLARWPLCDKSTYSAWTDEVRGILKDCERVALCGVVAECCVLATLMALIDAGKEVIYLTDCIAGQSRRGEEMTRHIAEKFVPVHTSVMDSETYLALRSAQARENNVFSGNDARRVLYW